MQWIAPLRLHPLLSAMLLLTGLAIAACRGGGGTTIPDPDRESAAAPRIHGVQVIAGDLVEGTQVTLAAKVTGLVTRWGWEFAAGSTPESSADSEPTITCPPPGRYQCKVRASNGFGVSKPCTYRYSVSPAIAPRVGTPRPEAYWMSKGSITRFSLPIDPSAGRPTQFRWDIPGGEVFGVTNNSIVAFRATQPGSFAARVVAENAYGAASSGTSYEIRETPHMGPLRLSISPELSQNVYLLHPSFSLILGDARPQVRYRLSTPVTASMLRFHNEFGSGELTLIGSTAGQISGAVRGCAWGWNCEPEIPFSFTVPPAPMPPAWENSPVAKAASPIYNSAALALLDGKPILIFTENGQYSGGPLFFAQAGTPEPARSIDWTVYLLADTPPIGPGRINLRISARNGKPFIAYSDPSGAYRLFEASSPHPSTAADWAEFALQPLSELVDGRDLAVASSGDVIGAIRQGLSTVNVYRLPSGSDIASNDWGMNSLTGSFEIGTLKVSTFQERPVIIAAEERVSSPRMNSLVVLAGKTVAPANLADWLVYDLKAVAGESRYDSPRLFGATSDAEKLCVSYAAITGGVARAPSLLLTSDPLGGTSAWNRITGARVEYFDGAHQVEHLKWRGNWLQIDATESLEPRSLVLSQAVDSAPNAANDWQAAMPEFGLAPAGFSSIAATDSHLYLLGIRDQTTPTLLWTTDDF